MKTRHYFLSLITFSLIWAGCITDNWGECMSGDMIEASCICDDGWGGVYCEYYIPTFLEGTYRLDNATCDSLPINLTTLRWRESLVAPTIVLLESDQLLRPITAIVRGNTMDDLAIPLQENFRIDSSGSSIPIQLQGGIYIYNDLRRLMIHFESPACTLYVSRH